MERVDGEETVKQKKADSLWRESAGSAMGRKLKREKGKSEPGKEKLQSKRGI